MDNNPEAKILAEYNKSKSKTPRKNLIKLVKHVNMLNPFPSENSWEYIFYDRLLTDEMVDFALKMKLRKPYYIQELAELNKMSVPDTARLADKMVHIGIIEYTSDDNGVDQLLLPVFAPGNFESVGLDPKISDEYPEVGVAFLHYVLELQKKIAAFMPMGGALMRTIPVEKAIANEPRKVSYEEVSYWIEKSAPSLAIADCQCRRFRRMVGEGTDDLEGEWCMELGKYAESCIRVGKARRITKEEAYDILREAEERGYVHQLSNIDGPDHSIFICNCNWDTCMALKTSWYTGTPNLSRSNYISEVNKDKCVACGGCVEVCPQNAVTLGQKLCQKTPVEIKDAKLPSDHFWGKKNWNPDLTTTRKNVVPETGTSPCKTNCPAHISVQGYLTMASEGRYSEALELIKRENPLPAVCGRICSRKCEEVCTRGDLDSPVAIDEIKKFIAQKDLDSATRFVPKKLYNKGQKIAVIGSGPAGISCAYYLAVYGHEVTVFEKEEKLGGMLTLGIPSFRLEKDVIEAEIGVLKELGVSFKTGIEVGKDITIQALRDEGYKGFYLAVGAQGGRALQIPGEDAEGVVSGVDFLRAVNLGNPTKLSGRVIVIGGGNVAVDVARTAARSGAEAVSMYCLESRGEMPAADDEVEETLHEGIAIENGWGPKEIIVTNGRVSAVVFKKCTAVTDSSGRFSPQYDENDTITVEADFVLTSIGQKIEWGGLLEGTSVRLNKNGTAEADGYTWATAEADIFAGGDAVTGPKFAIDAIAAGKQGAESLHRAVWEGHSLVLGRDRRDYYYLDKRNLNIGDYDTTPRQVPTHDERKAMSFSDSRLPLTEEQIKLEAARCLKCGAAHVDPGICIGCGLCTVQCKFDAITLKREYDAWGVPYEKLVGSVAKEAVSRPVRVAARLLKGKK